MAAAVGIKELSRCVFFGGLTPQVDDKTLYELGIQAGPVQNVKVQQDPDGNKKGFGFVTFAHLESAIYCLGLYRGLLQLFGSPVNVNFANQVVDPNEVSDGQKALFEKVKRLFSAAAEEPGGAGAARRTHQTARYMPYGAAASRSHGRERQQRGAGDRQHEYVDAVNDYSNSRYHSSRRDDYGSRDYAGYGHAGGDGIAQAEQSVAPTPVENWQSQLTAAATAAAAQFGGRAPLQASAAYNTTQQQQQLQNYQAVPLQQHGAYQQQQQQYVYQPPATSAAAAAPSGYATSTAWLTAAQQQYTVPAPAAPAAAPVQYQSSLPQGLQSQVYQAQQYQQPSAAAAAPTASTAYLWQQQYQQPQQQQSQYQQPQYQQQHYQYQQQQQPQVVLQAGYQQQPQVVVQQAAYQQPQQQQPQVTYFYQQ